MYNVSLVIVSWQRPLELARCMTAIGQLEGVGLQVIIVACKIGVQAAYSHQLSGQCLILETDEANVAKARNKGLASASAPLVAFIDDDAVPEPTWLKLLIAPFENIDIQMVGGQVLGRNGISQQWGQRFLTTWGESLNTPKQDTVVRTEGTNMAIRRKTLLHLNGFDPLFSFFHDDADLNMRVRDGILYVPEAIVHHGFAAGPHRRSDRVPKNLFQIGFSQAIFLRKHAKHDETEIAWEHFAQKQADRLIKLVQSGAIEPRDMRRLLSQLDAGHVAAKMQKISKPVVIETPAHAHDFQKPVIQKRHVLTGWHWQKRQLHERACSLTKQGKLVSVFSFSLTTLYHQINYTPDGYWMQSGGLFGRSKRSESIIQVFTMMGRVAAECQRLAGQRGFNDDLMIEKL